MRPDAGHAPRDAKRVVTAFRRTLKRYDGARAAPISSLADPPDAIRAAVFEQSGPVARRSGPDAARTLVLLVELEAFVPDGEAALVERSMKEPATLSSEERRSAKGILAKVAESQRAAVPPCAELAGPPHRKAEKAAQIAPHGKMALPVGAPTDLMYQFAGSDRGQGEGILAFFLLVGYALIRPFVEFAIRSARGTLGEDLDLVPFVIAFLTTYVVWVFANVVIRGPAALHRLTVMFAGRPRPVYHANKWATFLSFVALFAIIILIELGVGLLR